MGVTSAAGLVIGSIVGAGLFTLPAVLARAGTSSLITLTMITLTLIAMGAMLSAVMSGQLAKRVPKSDGGLGIALLGLWLPAAVNLAGVRNMARFPKLTVVLKFLPLVFVAIAGWFLIHPANFGAFNASGGSLCNVIGIAAGVALFPLIGAEVAAITAQRVRNPRRLHTIKALMVATLGSQP